MAAVRLSPFKIFRYVPIAVIEELTDPGQGYTGSKPSAPADNTRREAAAIDHTNSGDCISSLSPFPLPDKLLLSLLTNNAGVSGMIRVTFIAHDASKREIEIEPDGSLMQAAKSNSVPGIDADCGGACSCATCHVFVDKGWLARVGTIEHWEESMLGLTPDRQPNSRLACQIKLSDGLNGLVVTTPEFQY